MYCKNCGKEIPPGSRFCPNCGTQLWQEAPAREPDCPVSPAPVRPAPPKAEPENDGKKRCIKCGEEIPDDSVLCPYCGAWQEQEDSGKKEDLPKKSIDRRAFIAMAVVAVLLLAALILISGIVASGAGKSEPSLPRPDTEGSTEALGDSPQVQAAGNGQYFVEPDYELMCPLEIWVNGQRSYYLYLEYIGQPEDSYDSRQPLVSSPEEEDMSFYVEAGNSAEVYVPVGDYYLYYASGYDWQGPEDLFGEDTQYSVDKYVLSFYTDEESAYGYTLDLWDESEDNPDLEAIAPEDFPG